ncbi:acyl-CoA dehydrogenase family protein, partial [Candidatus Gracilibacteria bacterium]|nr:acyl-CoA dehydrogenase family protein [Candidatus Gracilibacteria bacterium]
MHFDLNEEQLLIQRSVREFSDRELAPNAHHVDQSGEFPAATFRKMATALTD